MLKILKLIGVFLTTGLIILAGIRLGFDMYASRKYMKK